MNDGIDSGRARALQDLSALADGEGDAAELLSACDEWRTDAQLRKTWHAYHLIGDVMRSEELASDPGRDAAFLRSLRERLAREPVILAPSVPAESAPPVRGRAMQRASGWAWKAPAAVAAGFVAVAGVLLATQGLPPGPGGGVGLLAQSLGAAAGPAGSTLPTAAAESQLLVADGQLVRDARLQRYLAAHKQFGGSSALGAPSGFMRAAISLPAER